MKKSPNNIKGAFTIIELLVVIAIIAILTAIIIPNLTGSKAKARDAKRVSDLGTIQIALELFYDRCKSYPDALSPTDDAGGACPTGITLAVFLPKVPVPPSPMPDAVGYEYAVSNDGKEYLLRVALESTSPALQDDIDTTPANWPSELDAGDACQDTGVNSSLKYQYCIGSN